ncbi:diacylglycerol/lipid kinase family protein [Mesorhizobium sp. ES1-6]|uniref:diacylglycerol/lipid kinase family protein n=1 Tax=Mesorhizobium sp. ES1-6 TaxID=2876626 RepID=UPI001CCDD288|nr:diacylglycerol kinase family protein [Mesorhizobium sp. ES1-6]MBZ9805069.1 diacylglycerol kinase family lipid kinase [Mesorhizobium sp. ES1-6]
MLMQANHTTGTAFKGVPEVAVLVLINDGAGGVAALDDIAATVHSGLLKRGFEAEVKLVAGDQISEAASRFVRQKAGSGENILVVGGGDGTLSSAAGVLAGTEVAMGVLPLGTLNHFAKDLGVPLELDAAMDVIAARRPALVDVAEVNGRIFLNNSSIGLYPFFVAERSAEQRRRGVGKLAAIGPALVRTFKAVSWQSVRISADTGGDQVLTPCVFVGNNFYDAGDFGRRKNLSARELCVYVIRQRTWFGLALLPFKIALGIVDTRSDLEMLRASKIKITSTKRETLVSVDGEATTMKVPLHFQIRPAALKVLAVRQPDTK